MRNIRRILATTLVGLGLIFLAGCQKGDTTRAADTSNSGGIWQKLTGAPEKITVPPGTEIEVRLDQMLSSNGNRSGDSFEATVAAPVALNNQVVIPQGARVRGRVVEAQASGHLKTPASLAITLAELEVGGGTYDITTSTYARRAKSHRGRNAKWIGGSAAGGALLGALVGGGKGAAIGAGVGAGGGTAAAYATGKKDIVLPSETMLRFVLHQPIEVEKRG